MGITRNMSVTYKSRVHVLKKQRIHRCQRLKRLQRNVSRKIKIAIHQLKEMNIRSAVKQNIQKIHYITKGVDIRSARLDQETRFYGTLSVCTAAIIGVFTGSILSSVAKAAVTTAVSSVISEVSRKKNSAMDHAVREAKERAETKKS
mmetsp:Transcript_22839/g.33863  ORF Transcript_22839/g.33863 Transcript_22839/m.33863 type:complete len:147 (-) Transcript_22839:712-1152(-)